jgi:hypothetical protein
VSLSQFKTSLEIRCLLLFIGLIHFWKKVKGGSEMTEMILTILKLYVMSNVILV